jgi:hypothetical protein
MATFTRARCAEGQLTAAQVNANSRAGTTILTGVPDRSITVLDCYFRAIGGAVRGSTAVVLEDTGGQDVNSQTVAQMTENTVVRAGGTGSTCTALGTALTKGRGLRIGCTVGDYATATHLDYCVIYKIDSN